MNSVGASFSTPYSSARTGLAVKTTAAKAKEAIKGAVKGLSLWESREDDTERIVLGFESGELVAKASTPTGEAIAKHRADKRNFMILARAAKMNVLSFSCY